MLWYASSDMGPPAILHSNRPPPLRGASKRPVISLAAQRPPGVRVLAQQIPNRHFSESEREFALNVIAANSVSIGPGSGI